MTSLIKKLQAAALAGVLLASGGQIVPSANAEVVDQLCIHLPSSDCPSFDFFWQPGDDGLLEFVDHWVRPPNAESWVSVVAPMNTYFPYEPLPIHFPLVQYAFLGGFWPYRYYWIPTVSQWNFGEGDDHLSVSLYDILSPKSHLYNKSSYGRQDTNAAGEPGYKVSAQIHWVAMVSIWGCKWGLAWCPWGPGGYARVKQEHVVPVRQILPVSIGT
jgi:hypothetical protein